MCHISRTQRRVKWTSHLYSNTGMLPRPNPKTCRVLNVLRPHHVFRGLYKIPDNHNTIWRNTVSSTIRAWVMTYLWRSNENINTFLVVFLLKAWLEAMIKSTWFKRKRYADRNKSGHGSLWQTAAEWNWMFSRRGDWVFQNDKQTEVVCLCSVESSS